MFGRSDPVFGPYAREDLADRSGADEQENNVRDGVYQRERRGRRDGGYISGKIESAVHPHHRPDVHEPGEQNARESAVNAEQNATALHRRREQSRDKTDETPGEHLKWRPRSLTEPEVREQSGQRAREKARFAAEIHRGYDDERGHGFEAGQRRKEYASDDGQGDERGDHDEKPHVKSLFFKADKERNAREDGDAKADPRVTPLSENRRADKDGGGDENA